MRTLTFNQSRHLQVKRCIAFLIFSFSHFLIFTMGAQTFTQRIQQSKTGQGTVTIHQSSEIDALVNTEQLVTRRTATPSGNTSGTTAAPAATAPSGSSTAKTTATAATPTDATTEPAPTDNTKKVMRGGVKVNGYRVQAFAGGNSRADRLKAEQIGNNIKSQLGNVPVYVHFYSPRWICRVGNYRTYEEAHQMLVSLRKLGYTQSSIVKGKITVQY